MNSPGSYDQYADQLLDSVFQNVKQSTNSVPALHEDQLFNQLLQNARYSNMSSPQPFNNDWLLMQQLQQQQQQMLLERQLMSTNNLSPLQSSPLAEFLANIAPTATLTDPAITTSDSTNPDADFIVVDEPAAPPKKIARVPVPSLPDPKPIEEPVYHLPNANSQLQLKKKKSFLRSLSSRAVKHQEVFPAAVIAATLASSAHHQYKDKKLEKLAKKQEQQMAKKQEQMAKKQEQQRKKKERATVSIEAKENLPPPMIDRRPSFWKPREEKPKGWWKGQRNQLQQEEYQQEYRRPEVNEDTEEEEEEEQLEQAPVVSAPPKKSKKQVVVKRVAVPPKKVSSLKVTQPKRPMAFKTPTKKNKVNGKKSSNSKEKADDAGIATQPVYVMPQQMYQPFYQQPMMMVPPQQSYGMMPGGNGYYYMPNMPNMMVPQPQAYQKEEEEAPKVRRHKSVYNPREASNDKCTIM